MAGWLSVLLISASLGAQAPDSATGGSTAQQLRPPRPAWVRNGSQWRPRLRLDNDAYNFWIHPGRRTDEEYTNGVLASFETLRGVFWGHRLGGGAPDCATDPTLSGRCLTTTLAIGQDMYTPNLFHAPYSSPDWQDERPYAGWLYTSLTGRSVSSRSARTVEVQLGVTGPPALGQVSQRVAHFINSKYTTHATGWETQVGFQPGIQSAYTHAVVALRAATGGVAVLDLVPEATATLGTVRTAAAAGGRARIGYNLSHPFDPRPSRRRGGLEYWISASGHSAYVARDFSLDGSLLRDGDRHVERQAGVRDYAFGAGLRLHRLLLQWEATTRSRQYTTGPGHHTFSSMSASWEFFDGHERD